MVAVTIFDLGARVRERWKSLGVTTSVCDGDCLQYSAHLSFPLHPILREYAAFSAVVGCQYNDDAMGFRFWPPAEVRMTRDVLVDAGYQCLSADASVVFADFMQESYWYSLWLAGPNAGMVSFTLGSIDGDDPQPPFATFHAFLELYLRDDWNMFRLHEDQP